jgi:sugar lactone lactonase YvrE
MMLGGQLAVFGGHGKAMLLSPEDGKQIAKVDVPDNMRMAPVVAGKTLYVVTGDAKLHALR